MPKANHARGIDKVWVKVGSLVWQRKDSKVSGRDCVSRSDASSVSLVKVVSENEVSDPLKRRGGRGGSTREIPKELKLSHLNASQHVIVRKKLVKFCFLTVSRTYPVVGKADPRPRMLNRFSPRDIKWASTGFVKIYPTCTYITNFYQQISGILPAFPPQSVIHTPAPPIASTLRVSGTRPTTGLFISDQD